uniref:Uncharacterized protein n=1 Tax=Desulfomonile tiedjei TaxID=2358 RepID=A0A7C4ATR9_9BACT
MLRSCIFNKSMFSLLAWGVVGVCVMAWSPSPCMAGGKKKDEKTTATLNRAAAGMRINLDASGKPVQAGGQAATSPVASKHTGLVVEKNPQPGGGIMVDLKGRFQNAIEAHRGPDGKVKLTCVPVDHTTTCPEGKEK